MNDAQLAACAQAAGFSHWATLDVSTIVLKQEVRDMCDTENAGAARPAAALWRIASKSSVPCPEVFWCRQWEMWRIASTLRQ